MASPLSKKGSNDKKKSSSNDLQPGVTTRNVARKAKIQTRAMSTNLKPSSSLLAAKKKALQKKRTNFEVELRDHFQNAMDSKNVEKGQVELVLEKRMLEHLCLWDPNYPECPERLSSIIDRCNELDLIRRCVLSEICMATKEDVSKLHSPSVYDLLLTTHKSDNTDYLESISAKYDAVYIHPSSHELSLMAAGSTVKIVEDVIRGKAGSGMALVRPPGHHAMTAEPCGYCFYNNVGLAAQHALTELKLSRILIVDWDVHHGQATQQMFYDDPRVVYFSIHRYEHGSFWPNLRQSNFNYVGTGNGTGYNFNVPLNQIKMQDSDYIAIWHQLLLPMALEFSPELVLCSAGYDSALGDEKGEMEISPACYAHLTHMLMGVTGTMVVVLEGGYCLASLAESAALTLRTLLGDPVPPLRSFTPPSESIQETILNCIYVHKPYWNCFNYQPTYSMDTTVLNVSDVTKEKHIVEVKWLGDEERPETFATRNCYPIQPQKFLDDVNRKLSQLKITTDLFVPQHRVCYVYDEAMLKHKNVHESDHPERPERISRIHTRLQEFKLLDRMRKLESRIATDEELELGHTSSLLSWLRSTATCSNQSLANQQEKYDSVYLHNDTFLSASVAVGSVLQVVDAVLGGEAGSGVCIVRPPGHHASEDLPCGFCLFNNVGVAAKYAMSLHSLKRILILDWDVHHGNGTQSMFINDPRVLYISLHRYDHGTFFPSSTEGNYTQVGESSGRGFNVNIPWNKRGMGDKEYLAAFTQIVLPIAYEFNPELVLVSAGFDACIGDPLGGCKVSPECYGRLTHWLMGLARGKLLLCLEGGYNVRSISYAMAMCTKALLGDPVTHNYESRSPPHSSAVESINDVIGVHKQYWKNLRFQKALPKENVLPAPAPSRGLTINKSKPTNAKWTKSEDTAKGSVDQDVFYDCCDNIEEVSCNSESSLNYNSDLNANDSNDSKGFDNANNNTFEIQLMCVEGSSQSGAEGEPSSIPPQPTQTLSEYLAQNMEALMNEDMFAVVPLDWCPHIDGLKPYSSECNVVQRQKCINCDHDEEIWICLECYIPACGRYVNGHMLRHFESTQHSFVLSLADLSVWCSSCESYVDHATLHPFKNAAHMAKFGEEMPLTHSAPS
ncbi:histone deacetylase 6 isoform X4 [Arctopsyche grandis]|uniref:histone deacetylase 6 isoform X4 n=1 Tax=Arctopsyche grandis TaxID=121162 RepID=UPI00406D85A9